MKRSTVAEHNIKKKSSSATKVGATYVFQNSRNSRHFSSSKLFRQLISIPIIVYDGEGKNINIQSKNKIHFLASLLHCVFKHENEPQITLAPKIRIVVMTCRTCADVIQPCRINLLSRYKWYVH